MASCLITGGAGFIGSHLSTTLVKKGWRVRVLDNLSTGKQENLAEVGDAIELVRGDIRDRAVVEQAVAGVEVVFHFAAMVSVPQSLVEPVRCHEICAGGTLNVVLAARDAGVRRLVYAASSSAYGDAGEGPIREDAPLRPISPYAAAKLAGEHYCSAFTAVSDLETVRLRFFNVFGPRQDPSSPYSGVISIFATRMLAGRRPTIYGDGLQTRDFVDVSDVVQALEQAAAMPGVSGGVFNVGTGRPTTLLDLVAAMNQALGTSLAPEFAPPRAGDIRHSLADITAITTRLGFVPQVSLAAGLGRCLEYYRGV